jgi:hypothetical protein
MTRTLYNAHRRLTNHVVSAHGSKEATQNIRQVSLPFSLSLVSRSLLNIWSVAFVCVALYHVIGFTLGMNSVVRDPPLTATYGTRSRCIHSNPVVLVPPLILVRFHPFLSLLVHALFGIPRCALIVPYCLMEYTP